MIGYAEFVKRKSQLRERHGFPMCWMPSFLFDFQSHLVNWALESGRGAIFADCGLGKTPMELVWARDADDEKHVHPLQLDVIDRCLTLWSNSGETVFTPFLGVGSEVYAAVLQGRRGVGAELKASYYRQAAKNVQAAAEGRKQEAETYEMFAGDAA